ncbi:MAG: M56 family metallopeptidase, partial [Lachnospiraceae bacterium]|nr:M56 family metallopeptidase [Lachnospiraceae bacterium]
MSGLFLKLLNMSVSAGWLILAVVLVRVFFRKAPKWFNCLLWALVAVRLICPFSIESRLSLVPEAEIVNTDTDTGRPYIRSGITTVDNTVNTYLGEHYNEDVTAPVKESVKSVAALIQMITIVWMIGAFG